MARTFNGSQIDINLDKATPKKRKVALKSNNPSKKVFIANHHTAIILVPRTAPGRNGAVFHTILERLKFPPGTVIQIDSEIWEEVKLQNDTLRSYLDCGLLQEVKSKRATISSIRKTSNLILPEHLRTPKEVKGNIRMERATVGEMVI